MIEVARNNGYAIDIFQVIDSQLQQTQSLESSNIKKQITNKYFNPDNDKPMKNK